jgi:hypothetical protein
LHSSPESVAETPEGVKLIARRTTEAGCRLDWREHYSVGSYFWAKYARSEVSAERAESDALFPNIASCIVVFKPIEKPPTGVRGLLSFSTLARADPIATVYDLVPKITCVLERLE